MKQVIWIVDLRMDRYGGRWISTIHHQETNRNNLRRKADVRIGISQGFIKSQTENFRGRLDSLQGVDHNSLPDVRF